MYRARRELPEDRDAIRDIVRRAFEREAEAKLVDLLRKTTPPEKFISMVSLDETNTPIGHALFTPITIEAADPKNSTPAMALAPVAVLPDHQNRGAGAAAIEGGIAACREGGHAIIVVVGHPQYYPRFGFQPARPSKLEAPFPVDDDAFMVLALTPNALERAGGMVTYPAPFMDPDVQ